MKIALFAKGWDMARWSDRIKRVLPDAEVRLPGALGDPSDIDYALVWRPDRGFLAALPNLKLIGSLGAGVDFLFDDPSLPDVPILRVIDEDLTGRMSEYVLLQVLLHHRQTLRYLGAQKERHWLKEDDVSAKEIAVSVLGLGELGLDAARKLQMVGYDVAGWSRSPKAIEGLQTYHGAEGLEAIIKRTDILVSLLPHTPQTEGLLNLSLFRRLKQDGALGGPVLINAGRGKLQIEADIVAALTEGSLKGASLDVFEVEPLCPDSPLWSLPNVILTPHNAAVSDPDAVSAHLARQIRAFEAGEPMEGLVDQQRGY